MPTPTDKDRGEAVETKTLEHVRQTLVLLVEDDDEMRKILASVLRRHGYRVTGARDGHQAIEYLDDIAEGGNHSRMPQFLLTDQRMPGVSGLDVIEATHAAGMRIPAILITAFLDTDVHDRARALGPPVLEKPFEMIDLMALVRLAAPPRLD
jgi:CheY-like chemotaxis protein